MERTAEDVRTNPLPGDVVRSGEFYRAVTGAPGGTGWVTYRFSRARNLVESKRCYTKSIHVDLWRHAHRKAEVLYIAEAPDAK